jgi:hypothetical protein
VGIAGADDLGAPDLAEGVKVDAADKGRAADDRVEARLRPANGLEERKPATSTPRRTEKVVRPARAVLAPDQSALLREKLLSDIDRLQSADEAANWVHTNLAAKNTLIAADADAVEAGFRERLATIELGSAAHQQESQSPAVEAHSPLERSFVAPSEDPDAARIIMPASPRARRCVVPKTIRLRDKEHCKFVAFQPCVVCGRAPSEAHHIRFAQPRALGRKVSDEYTVPVCRLHHRELHGYGDEASWWAAASIDPLPIALELWRRSRLTQV